ncbi:hypothetical protein HPB51_008709 [Rhipicephalus microplus]|uniref:Uncharacterized protein n=1 Tax=Rhipicephalus microplus TaxID=6941 RepID=A0A9J6EZU4_RHIMP|nr:hypothetical protein HPB51_008709 [Rhipicephalus microplus]
MGVSKSLNERLKGQLKKPTVSELADVELKKTKEHEEVERIEQEVEKPPEKTPVTAVLEAEQKKPAEEDVERVKPEVHGSPDETRVSTVPEDEWKKLIENDSAQKVELEYDLSREEAPAEALPKEERNPAKPDIAKLVEPELSQPTEKTPSFTKNVRNPTSAEQIESHVFRAPEETSMRAVSEEERKLTEPDNVETVERKSDRSSEDITTSAVYDVEPKKPENIREP